MVSQIVKLWIILRGTTKEIIFTLGKNYSFRIANCWLKTWTCRAIYIITNSYFLSDWWLSWLQFSHSRHLPYLFQTLSFFFSIIVFCILSSNNNVCSIFPFLLNPLALKLTLSSWNSRRVSFSSCPWLRVRLLLEERRGSSFLPDSFDTRRYLSFCHGSSSLSSSTGRPDKINMKDNN